MYYSFCFTFAGELLSNTILGKGFLPIDATYKIRGKVKTDSDFIVLILSLTMTMAMTINELYSD